MKTWMVALLVLAVAAGSALACPPPGSPQYDGPELGTGPTDPSSGGTTDGSGSTDSSVLAPTTPVTVENLVL